MAAGRDNIMHHVHRLLGYTVYSAIYTYMYVHIHVHTVYMYMYVVAVCSIRHNYALAPSIAMVTTCT